MQDGKSDCLEHLYLREEFVGSLCIADKLGVLRSITVIAKRMHSSQSYSSSSSTSFLVSKLTSLTVTLDPNESKVTAKAYRNLAMISHGTTSMTLQALKCIIFILLDCV